MDTRTCLVFATLYHFVIFKTSYQTPRKISTKKLNVQKIEDYSFEGELNKARDECSYMALVNTTINRNKMIEMIKEKTNRKRLREFYEEKEKEKERAKKYYENVKKQSRKRVLESGNPRWEPNFNPRRIHPPPHPVFHGNVHKRSANLGGRRRKISFSGASTFIDYNNCSSRCIFARMQMVNPLGFPVESLITKLIDDKITNRRFRLEKVKKVASCFRKMEEAVYDDSCIFSTRLFECLDLEEQYSWSHTK